MSSISVKARLASEADRIYASSISNFESAIEPNIDSRIRYVPRFFIIIAIFVPFFIGKMNFPYITIILLIYAIDFIYSRRMHKFTRSMNNLVYKEALRMKAYNNFESVEWMNHIISRVWGVVETEISRQVIAKVNLLLQEKTPNFISSIKLSSFTLGSSAPTVLGITHYEEVDAETICIEAEFSFIPLEIGKDAYHYVTKKRGFEWNSKIVLTARLGTKVRGVGVDLPILVKKISFKGRMKITLQLCPERVVKTLEVMFIEKPEIDFDLVPLKTVDLMDVPGLSKWIRFMIDTGLKTLINPNSLVIDLTQPIKKEVVKGVLLLRLSNMIMKEEDTVEVVIGIDGRKFYHTAKKSGENVYFNEYFFLIIRESDEIITLTVTSNGSNYGEGKIYVKMICDLEKHCEAVRIYKKGNVRGVINCSFRLYRTEKDETIMEEQSSEKSSDSRVINGVLNRSIISAVVTVKVIQVEDLRGLNYTRKKIYSTFFTLLASPRVENRVKEESPFSFVTGPVNATALLIGGAFSSATNVLGMNSKQDTLPSSTSTFFLYESKTAPDTNSPLFNEQEKFFSRDLKQDYLYIRITDSDNNEVIGSFDMKMEDIKNEEAWYRLKNAQRGRIKLSTEVNKINVAMEHFAEYEKAIWIRIKSIQCVYEDSVIYGVAKTGQDNFYIEPFCIGDLQNDRDIILPANDNVKLRIYRMGESIDDLIGEVNIDSNNHLVNEEYIVRDKRIDRYFDSNKIGNGEDECDDTQNSGNIRLPILLNGDESGSMHAVVRTTPLTTYKGTSHENIFKIVQVRFKRFYNMNDEFLVEFKSATETLRKSSISRNYALSERFILLVGDCEIRAVFKSAEIGVNKIIGDCLIPKREMKERVIIDEGRISTDIEIKVLSCNFPFTQLLRIGVLELVILGGINLAYGSQRKRDPFVKIFLNGSRIHKTSQVKNTFNPKWNESINIKINSMVDILRFEVFDWNQFEKNKLIAFREIPFYFLKEGKSEHEIRLVNAETFKPDKGKLMITFSFAPCAEKHKNGKIKSVLKA